MRLGALALLVGLAVAACADQDPDPWSRPAVRGWCADWRAP